MSSNINITVYNSKAAQDAAERAELAAKKTENATDNLIDPTPPGTMASPAVIPDGPVDSKGKFEPAPGFYQGFPEVTEDRRWYFFWNKTTWSLIDMGELPGQPKEEQVKQWILGESYTIQSYTENVNGIATAVIAFPDSTSGAITSVTYDGQGRISTMVFSYNGSPVITKTLTVTYLNNQVQTSIS